MPRYLKPELLLFIRNIAPRNRRETAAARRKLKILLTLVNRPP